VEEARELVRGGAGVLAVAVAPAVAVDGDEASVERLRGLVAAGRAVDASERADSVDDGRVARPDARLRDLEPVSERGLRDRVVGALRRGRPEVTEELGEVPEKRRDGGVVTAEVRPADREGPPQVRLGPREVAPQLEEDREVVQRRRDVRVVRAEAVLMDLDAPREERLGPGIPPAVLVEQRERVQGL